MKKLQTISGGANCKNNIFNHYNHIIFVDVLVRRCYFHSVFWPFDVLGQKVDVFVVDVLEIDVLEIVQLGRPAKIHILITFISYREQQRQNNLLYSTNMTEFHQIKKFRAHLNKKAILFYSVN